MLWSWISRRGQQALVGRSSGGTQSLGGAGTKGPVMDWPTPSLPLVPILSL